ncbi:hypothetical protein A8B78_16105 [Jannaschia sp. EhC01]|nr:hypothetical protein A8B78_16105 [Jannaschia sp. EhC01]
MRQSILIPLLGMGLLAGPAVAQDFDPALMDCVVRTRIALDQAQLDLERGGDQRVADLVSILQPTATGLVMLMTEQADCSRPISDMTEALSLVQSGIEAEFEQRVAEGMAGPEAYAETILNPVRACGSDMGLEQIAAAFQRFETNGYACGWGQ